jgi:hypothetical protein
MWYTTTLASAYAMQLGWILCSCSRGQEKKGGKKKMPYIVVKYSSLGKYIEWSTIKHCQNIPRSVMASISEEVGFILIQGLIGSGGGGGGRMHV